MALDTPADSEQYEFDDFENERIRTLARRMDLYAKICLFGGVVATVLLLLVLLLMGAMLMENYGETTLGLVALFPGLAVTVLMAKHYLDAAGRFREVVETHGRDIELMLDALDSLGRAFQLEVAYLAFLILAGAATKLGVML